MNFKLPFLISILLCATLSAHGSIAIGRWTTYTQSDGTTLQAKLCGDKGLHYYITRDSVPLLRAQNGDFHYLRASGYQISSSGVIAHEKQLRSTTEQGYASSLEALRNVSKRLPKSDMRRNARKQRFDSYKRRKVLSDKSRKRGLVIAAEFKDIKFKLHALDSWTKILNEEGFNGSSIKNSSDFTVRRNVPGSVHDYFMDQSNGMFDITFDVIGPVGLSKPLYYYGQNSSNPSDEITDDINVCDMVTEACNAAKGKVNFADYDWDNDGEVDMVLILYAGQGEHYQGNPEYYIWPHEFALSGYPKYPDGYTIDGIRINTYACSPEISYGKNLSGLGTFCHEFAHCLGFPDFYDTTGDYDYLGNYDLLDSGNNNGGGWFPCNFTAYERFNCGWYDPIELTKDTTVARLEPLSYGGNAYYIENKCSDENISEFYILENRQKTGWDKHIPAAGLIITHYDIDPDAWASNTVNVDPLHPRAAIVPANNDYGKSAGYPFPYEGNNSLTNTTTPAATVYNKNIQGSLFLDQSVTDITHQDGLISFSFKGLAPTAVHTATTGNEALLKGRPATISDLSGRLVEKVAAYNGTGHLPPGIYIVTDGKGNSLKAINRP